MNANVPNVPGWLHTKNHVVHSYFKLSDFAHTLLPSCGHHRNYNQSDGWHFKDGGQKTKCFFSLYFILPDLLCFILLQSIHISTNFKVFPFKWFQEYAYSYPSCMDWRRPLGWDVAKIFGLYLSQDGKLVVEDIPQMVWGMCFGIVGGVKSFLFGPVRGYHRMGPQCLLTPPVSASSIYAAVVYVSGG
jgi:hypothetical protein